MPRRCYSDRLRNWVGHELVDAAYDHGARTIERILGIKLSKQALETLVAEDSQDVDAFYEQKPPPSVGDERPLLVVQADGAGVRLVGTEPSERTGHLTSKREAVVTTIYTVDRHVRSASQMAEALLHDASDEHDTVAVRERPSPIAKETRATLDGKDAAFERLRQRIHQRDGDHIQDRVALTDGAEPLQERMKALPRFTLVLDIIHVLGYLWDAAQAVHGNWKSDACRGYVRVQLEALLEGQTQAVIDDLSHRADGLSAYRRAPVDAAIRYFTPDVNHKRPRIASR